MFQPSCDNNQRKEQHPRRCGPWMYPRITTVSMSTRVIDAETREVALDELVRLRIRGATQAECAKELGFTTKTIMRWEKRADYKLKMKRTREIVFARTSEDVEEIVKHNLEGVREQIEQEIEVYAVEGIRKIRQLMHDSKHEGIQLKAATDMADRSPKTQKTKRVEGKVAHAFLTPELLASAAKLARELQENEAIGRRIEPVDLSPLLEEGNDDDSERD